MTNASIARQALICPWASFSAAGSARFRNITRRRTILISLDQNTWRYPIAIIQALDVIENDAVYRTTNPKCEPQLGKRGLYGTVGGDKDSMALLWVLNLSDGTQSLLDIAERSKLPFAIVRETAHKLQEHGLLTGPH